MRPKPKNKVVDSKPEDAYGWRLYNPAATHVFVFIHGLFSSAAACWTAKNKAFWPDLVSKDKRLSPAAVFCVEYHTRFSAGDYGIADCARSVMDQMSRPNEDESMRPIDFQEIIFVAHSMGGIICRYVLESNRHIFEPKKIGVVLMASPSTGSVYADLLSPIRKFMNFRQGGELRTTNELLRDIDTRFKDIVSGPRKWPRICGAEAVEHKGPYKGFKAIVNRESAARYFGAPSILPETNHGTIVKPEKTDAVSHNFLVDFFTSNFKEGKVLAYANTPKKEETVLNEKPGDPLFDMYNLRHELYYLTRSIDERALQGIGMHSLWVYGPSGVGKTSTIRRLVATQNKKPIELYLANCPEVSEAHVLRELAETLSMQTGTSPPPSQTQFNWIAARLVEHATLSDIVLYLDEIPMAGDESLDDVVALVAKLLAKTKAMGDGSVRFIISSIAKPNLSNADNPDKFKEHLVSIELAPWTKDEMRRLVALIIQNMQGLQFNVAEEEALIEKANGSPRFVKLFFRYSIHNRQATFAECLSAARLENLG